MSRCAGETFLPHKLLTKEKLLKSRHEKNVNVKSIESIITLIGIFGVSEIMLLVVADRDDVWLYWWCSGQWWCGRRNRGAHQPGLSSTSVWFVFCILFFSTSVHHYMLGRYNLYQFFCFCLLTWDWHLLVNLMRPLYSTCLHMLASLSCLTYTCIFDSFRRCLMKLVLTL